MKSFGVLSLILFLGATSLGFAQATSPRSITKKVVPQQPPPASPAQKPPASPPSNQNASTNRVAPAPREKSQAEKDEIVRKTVEFQKQRAEQGYATAQYDLGMRYLNGDGVEKDEQLARKWLEAAGKQGHARAAQKLQELDKK